MNTVTTFSPVKNSLQISKLHPIGTPYSIGTVVALRDGTVEKRWTIDDERQ
jgi:hypothetical protein